MNTSNPRKRPSCTTNRTYVGQDKGAKLLRSGTTPIVYTERVLAIDLLRKRPSCATFFPFVVQDKGGDYAA